MGLRLFNMSASKLYDKPLSGPMVGASLRSAAELGEETKVYSLGNPNPKDYKIIRSITIKNYLVVKINYPSCTNYEGNKILVFKNTTLKQIMKQGGIDPHFSNNKKFKFPIARFEPTERGWRWAVDFARMIQT